MIDCWLHKNYGEEADSSLEADNLVQEWWQSMIQHIPALRRSTQQFPDWSPPGTLTQAGLKNILRTLFVWLSWIHEDVGHSAAAYVYNPVYTPMNVPADGVGVPALSWTFNALAYRGFAFLHRSVLMDEPPAFWFEGCDSCRQCFTHFQDTLAELGRSDP